jgi:hypothetical protein
MKIELISLSATVKYLSDNTYNYAFKIEGIPSTATIDQLNNINKYAKVVYAFTKEAKVTRADAKGKATVQSVKNWVKLYEPTQFYARWKKDTEFYKDDSVEVYYVK